MNLFDYIFLLFLCFYYDRMLIKIQKSLKQGRLHETKKLLGLLLNIKKLDLGGIQMLSYKAKLRSQIKI